MEKTYIVALKEGVDYDQFWNEIENISPTDGFVPSRRVDISNDKNGIPDLCEYLLTDAEAEQLRNDPRVLSVELPIEKNPYITVGPYNLNFTKPNNGSSNYPYVNWGLPRHSNTADVYDSNGNTSSGYTYNIDGTGVDVVISDTGIQWDHPEFQDSNGVSRVKRINWYQVTGVGNQNGVDSYVDTNGHGTHVAGTVAGKTYGWAKNSHIYAIKTIGNNISSAEAMRAILLWHQRKTNPSDPIYTGRPTVVNMSWGSSFKLITVNNGVPDPTNLALLLASTTGGKYRNQVWSKNGLETTFTDRGILVDDLANPINRVCWSSMQNGFPMLNDEVDSTLNSMINAGIIVCIAAGNSSYKVDSPSIDTSRDFNNYLNTNLLPTGKLYYHRGSSPTKNLNYPGTMNAIKVGNIDSIKSGLGDQPNEGSMKGPGVDLWAAGTFIMATGSNNDSSGATAPYFLDNRFRQNNLSGTSMASPQVAGIAALYLQQNPTATPAQVKQWFLDNAKETILNTGTDSDYTNGRSLLGGAPKVAYINPVTTTPTTSLKVKNQAGSWQNIKKIYAKDTNNAWQPVKAVWTKTASGWQRIQSP